MNTNFANLQTQQIRIPNRKGNAIKTKTQTPHDLNLKSIATREWQNADWLQKILFFKEIIPKSILIKISLFPLILSFPTCVARTLQKHHFPNTSYSSSSFLFLFLFLLFFRWPDHPLVLPTFNDMSDMLENYTNKLLTGVSLFMLWHT